MKAAGDGKDVNMYCYCPSNPFCQPYWDALYENSYPSPQECEKRHWKLSRTSAELANQPTIFNLMYMQQTSYNYSMVLYGDTIYTCTMLSLLSRSTCLTGKRART